MDPPSEDDSGTFFYISQTEIGWVPSKTELHWPSPCITMDSVPPSEGGYSGSIPDMGIRKALQHGALFCLMFIAYFL